VDRAGTWIASAPAMVADASIMAWSRDDRQCVLVETPSGWIVRMALAGLSSIEQPCTSLRDAFKVAAGWRRRCDEATAIDPKAA
jgi:hypothetical protein